MAPGRGRSSGAQSRPRYPGRSGLRDRFLPARERRTPGETLRQGGSRRSQRPLQPQGPVAAGDSLGDSGGELPTRRRQIILARTSPNFYRLFVQ
jgi:hypothetical protein